ncbi:MAG: hypothetical protein FWG93_01860 [Oscillospiraceae bacterium]|nr:hypothetical protein [Oscillospiraceae bacterium]
MRYFWNTAVKTITRALPVYLPPALLMAAGFAVVYVLFSGVFSYRDHIKQSIGAVDLSDVVVTASFSGSADGAMNSPRIKGLYTPGPEAILTPEDLEYIGEAFAGRIRLRYIFGFVQGTITNYITPDYLDLIGNFAPEGDDWLLCGRDEIESIRALLLLAPNDEIGFARSFPFDYDEERGVFTPIGGGNEITVYAIEDVDFSGVDLSHLDGNAYDDRFPDRPYRHMVFIPIKHYFDVYRPTDRWYRQDRQMQVSAADPQALSDLFIYLNTAHQGEVLYSGKSHIAEYLQKINEEMRMLAVIAPVTVLVSVIILINFMGLQMLSVKRRKYALAVQMACGAPRASVLGGLLAASAITMLASAVLALGLGYAYLARFKPMLAEAAMTARAEAAAILFGAALLAAVLANLPALVRAARMSPAEILTEQ